MFGPIGSKIHQPKQANYIQGGAPMGGGSGGPMKQMAMMGMKSALAGSPMAPMAGILGGLFNEGGKVPFWQRVKNTIWGTGPKKGSIAEQINWGGQNKNDGGYIHKNMGGMAKAPLNPYGYNEGGAVTETPIKKVMDEQKLDQQALAFELGEARKSEMHALDMKIKQKQFEMAQKMKKEASTTSKKPQAPLASK